MTDEETELAQAFALGVSAGQMLGEEPEACSNCTCGLDDADVEHEERYVTEPFDFGEDVRDLLVEYGVIEGDEIVSSVRVCPEEVVAFVRE